VFCQGFGGYRFRSIGRDPIRVSFLSDKSIHRIHTEWQWTISGVHSIMMEKSALTRKVGVARLPTFTLFTITYKVAVYTTDERADTLPLFHLYPYMYSVRLSMPNFATLTHYPAGICLRSYSINSKFYFSVVGWQYFIIPTS
jgi:hypothetical protein